MSTINEYNPYREVNERPGIGSHLDDRIHWRDDRLPGACLHVAGGAVLTAAPLGRTLVIAHLSSTLHRHVGPDYYWAGRVFARRKVARGVSRQRGGSADIISTRYLDVNAPRRKSLCTFEWLQLHREERLCSRQESIGQATDVVPRPPNTVILPHSRVCCGWSGHDDLERTTVAIWPPADPDNNKPYQCVLIHGSSSNPQANPEQILTTNNLSDATFTDDATAIMVPPQMPDVGLFSVGYQATTLGIKSICTSVTSQCINMNDLGPDTFLITNCSSSVNFNISSGCNPYQAPTNQIIGGALDPDGLPLACEVNNNSHSDSRFGAVVVSQAYYANISSSGEEFVGDTGFFLHGNGSAYNVLTCELKSLSVTYQYFNGSLSDSTPSTLEQGQHISDGSWAGLEYVPNAIDGAGLFSGSDTEAFAERLSLVTLATTAYLIILAPVLERQFTQTFTGSRFSFAPFLLLVAVLVVTVLAVHEVRKAVPGDVVYARSWLIDPATVISHVYGPEDTKVKPTSSIKELFGFETADDRLSVAVHNGSIGSPIIRRSPGFVCELQNIWKGSRPLRTLFNMVHFSNLFEWNDKMKKSGGKKYTSYLELPSESPDTIKIHSPTRKFIRPQ
ncbi:hypothetical protein DFH07DRAFT_776967 [Mycena maculata]|uniref:Uncharacterized protein n=1 Tax=Mycena maculata TaxID=230809 RepID=A0AAD7ILA6_9AGAR|nr:hypothetical protein DFH07DRAFT_776967 [Mycena maculata]